MFKHKKNSKIKAGYRTIISRKRRYLTLPEKTKLDGLIMEKLKNLPEWKKADNVLIYIAHKNEIQTFPLIKEFIKSKQIIVPKTHLRFHSLSLHHIKSDEDLFLGRYGLIEPRPHTKMIDPEEIKCAIVPGTVFDKQGHRIGYGKGYYDKLNKFLKCPKISLAYSFQIIQNIPAEKHDVKIDILITEKKIYRFNH